MGKKFSHTSDWEGDYRGWIDGRAATLEIGGIYAIYPPNSFQFQISVVDSGEAHYSGKLILSTGPKSHILPGFGLWTKDGKPGISFSRLLLHTWDTRFISGETIWNGTLYGCSFTRA